MTLRTVFLYQFGTATAIRTVAESKPAVWVGCALVLVTAIPRNYDQTFILETPLWLFGPLIFSLISGLFVFSVIDALFLSRNFDPGAPRTGWRSRFRSFLGLFWMTAPIAWLYAIPVERFLGSYQAAQANIALLATVALWRVVLLARVLSVLQGAHPLRALGWVLLPACLEVLAVSMLGGSLAKRVMASMSGMRNSPEEDLLSDALGIAFTGAIIVGLFTLLALAVKQNQGTVAPFPVLRPSTFPRFGLLTVSVFWVLVAIKPQIELHRNYVLEGLLQGGRYSEALRYLSRHQRLDFAPARRIAPDPYEYGIFTVLPGLFEAMDGKERAWVREEYLRHLEVMLSHRLLGGKASSLRAIVRALERMPEGPRWIQHHKTALGEAAARLSQGYGAESEAEKRDREGLLEHLNKLGVSVQRRS